MSSNTSLSTDFAIVQLLASHCDAAMHLLKDLPAHKKKFIAVKERPELLQNIMDDYVIGVIDQRDQQLVAISMLRTDSHEALFHGLTTYKVDKKIPHEQPTGVITTVVVKDGAEGQGIMKAMIEHLVAHANFNGYKSVSARVVDGNDAPLKRFKKCEFEILGHGTDDAGKQRTFVIKELAPIQPVAKALAPSVLAQQYVV